MKFQYLASNFKHKESTLLLKVFLLVDIMFIIGHISSTLLQDYFEPGVLSAFLVTQDRGYPELFQYLKCLAIVLIVAKLVIASKKYDYLPWLFLFLIMFIDDAFMLHERFGHFFAEILVLQPMYGLRAVDFGELIYATFLGLIFSGPLLWYYYKGSGIVKKTFFDIFILFSILLFFGVALDMLHQVFEEYYIMYAVFGLIEDGGEMIALSVLVWYFYFIASVSDGERTFLYYYFFPKKKT